MNPFLRKLMAALSLFVGLMTMLVWYHWADSTLSLLFAGLTMTLGGVVLAVQALHDSAP
ncbi:MAG: hypothetical protein QF519_04695 [Candidatus Poseidoniia archaeon]|nr:hypothetical protein [Candidatus Poseidoniia archaeon]